MEQIFNKIINGIKYGIEIDNNASRPFDILDYFEITTIPIEDLYYDIKNKVDKEELIVFRNFVKKNRINIESDKMYFRQLFQMKEEYNTLRDKLGIPIPNTGKTLTNYEKQMIKEYLEYMNIPITYNTYTCAVYRYLNEDIKILKKCISLD